MTAPEKIISDEDVIHVHANANFGSMTPREVVNDGVRKYAIGYQGGATQIAILREHGLITKPKGCGYKADLTKKGKEYARAIYHTRTALSQAQVAAAYEAAAGIANSLLVRSKFGTGNTETQCVYSDFVGASIINATPADATAAMQAMIDKAVGEHLSEIARLRKAIDNIDELNMLPPDEDGHRWWNSDLIGQEVIFSRRPAAAIRKGAKP